MIWVREVEHNILHCLNMLDCWTKNNLGGGVEHNLLQCMNLLDRWTKNNLGDGGCTGSTSVYESAGPLDQE
jgi:hypothetical protein